MDDEKEIRWIDSAYADLLDFPAEAKREAGFQLSKVQAGLEPSDAIYVLHCFEKKSQTTSAIDKAIASTRYRAIVAKKRSST